MAVISLGWLVSMSVMGVGYATCLCLCLLVLYWSVMLSWTTESSFRKPVAIIPPTIVICVMCVFPLVHIEKLISMAKSNDHDGKPEVSRRQIAMFYYEMILVAFIYKMFLFFHINKQRISAMSQGRTENGRRIALLSSPLRQGLGLTIDPTFFTALLFRDTAAERQWLGDQNYWSDPQDRNYNQNRNGAPANRRPAATPSFNTLRSNRKGLMGVVYFLVTWVFFSEYPSTRAIICLVILFSLDLFISVEGYYIWFGNVRRYLSLIRADPSPPQISFAAVRQRSRRRSSLLASQETAMALAAETTKNDDINTSNTLKRLSSVTELPIISSASAALSTISKPSVKGGNMTQLSVHSDSDGTASHSDSDNEDNIENDHKNDDNEMANNSGGSLDEQRIQDRSQFITVRAMCRYHALYSRLSAEAIIVGCLFMFDFCLFLFTFLLVRNYNKSGGVNARDFANENHILNVWVFFTFDMILLLFTICMVIVMLGRLFEIIELQKIRVISTPNRRDHHYNRYKRGIEWIVYINESLLKKHYYRLLQRVLCVKFVGYRLPNPLNVEIKRERAETLAVEKTRDVLFELVTRNSEIAIVDIILDYCGDFTEEDSRDLRLVFANVMSFSRNELAML